MADLHDVENALVTIIAAALYPNGTGQASAITAPCKVLPGWPPPQMLAGTVSVSVFAIAAASKLTSRYPTEWMPLTTVAATITAAVAGNVVTLGGTVSRPQNVTLIVNGKPYSYAVQAGDTLTSIATGVATLVNADVACTSSGAVITAATTARIVARVGGSGTAIKELRRQEQRFQVTVWSPTPELRAAAVPVIDTKLASINFITLADGMAARIYYFGTASIDTGEIVGSYRRDLFFVVEYATTITETESQITSVTDNITGGPMNPPTPGGTVVPTVS